MKKADFDRIIVETNERMTQIISWWYKNKSWLDDEEFNAPMESGLIVMQEEGIDIGFESRADGLVTISVYPEHIEVAAMQFELDPVTTAVSGHRFPNKMRHQKEKLLKVIFEADHTDVKESVKYLALMQFAAHYEEIVQIDEKQNVRRTRHEAKMLRKNPKKPLNLVKKTYVVKEFSDDDLHKFGEKRSYTKPDHEVQVRGFYRTMKSGKKVWVKPFSRYKDKGNKQPKEYKV